MPTHALANSWVFLSEGTLLRFGKQQPLPILSGTFFQTHLYPNRMQCAFGATKITELPWIHVALKPPSTIKSGNTSRSNKILSNQHGENKHTHTHSFLSKSKVSLSPRLKVSCSTKATSSEPLDSCANLGCSASASPRGKRCQWRWEMFSYTLGFCPGNRPSLSPDKAWLLSFSWD